MTCVLLYYRIEMLRVLDEEYDRIEVEAHSRKVATWKVINYVDNLIHLLGKGDYQKFLRNVFSNSISSLEYLFMRLHWPPITDPSTHSTPHLDCGQLF